MSNVLFLFIYLFGLRPGWVRLPTDLGKSNNYLRLWLGKDRKANLTIHWLSFSQLDLLTSTWGQHEVTAVVRPLQRWHFKDFYSTKEQEYKALFVDLNLELSFRAGQCCICDALLCGVKLRGCGGHLRPWNMTKTPKPPEGSFLWTTRTINELVTRAGEGGTKSNKSKPTGACTV